MRLPGPDATASDPAMNFDLAGKVVLITGSAGVFGEAFHAFNADYAAAKAAMAHGLMRTLKNGIPPSGPSARACRTDGLGR